MAKSRPLKRVDQAEKVLLAHVLSGLENLLGHVRHSEAWANGVDSNVLTRQLTGGGLGQGKNSSLRG